MTTLQQWVEAQANPEVVHNRNFDTLSAAGIFAKKHSTTSLLVWGYYGGRFNGNTIADGTVTLTNTTTNYVVVKISDGVVSTSTVSTNWNNAADYRRLYQLTTAGGVVTATVDARWDVGGLFLGAAVTQGAALTQTGEMMSGFIGTLADKSYRVVVKAAHGGTITEVTTVAESGTCTATFKVNSTALGGTASSVSSTETSQAHASANTFAAGDDIVITVSANSACLGMSFTIKYTRVYA